MADARLENVTKVFADEDEEIVAVEGVSLDVEDGEFVVLVGPSGCGKSTTLRLVAGLETVTEGDVYVGGERVNDVKPKDRDIAMVFQNYALYPHKTSRENMAFGLEMTTDLSGAEIAERVEDAAEMLDITDLLDRKPNALSGGQQQRVALGRAIVRDPQVFLMDEPLSNLDAKLRTQMRTELQELHRRLGTATIYVTHDQTEAMTMGDRIAVLDDGTLQQVGTPLECYYEPANRFVAGFIGSPSMNFLDLEFDAATGRGVAGEFEYGFTDDQADAVREAGVDRVTLGVRPEDVELATESGPRTAAADVSVVEPMGSERVVHMTVAGEEFTGSVSGDLLVGEDETVRVRFPPETVHAFEARSGDRIFNRERTDEELPAAAKI